MGWSSQLCSQLCLGSRGMWSQDGHRGVSVLSPAVLGASSPWCPWARGAAHPCSFQSRLCQGCRGWSQLCVLLLCLCQEWDLSPDELRCLQTPRPPTRPVPAPGGSSESQDSHARALRCGDQEGKARCRWGQLLTGLHPCCRDTSGESQRRNYGVSVGIPKSCSGRPQSQRGPVQADPELGFSRWCRCSATWS